MISMLCPIEESWPRCNSTVIQDPVFCGGQDPSSNSIKWPPHAERLLIRWSCVGEIQNDCSYICWNWAVIVVKVWTLQDRPQLPVGKKHCILSFFCLFVHLSVCPSVSFERVFGALSCQLAAEEDPARIEEASVYPYFDILYFTYTELFEVE